AALRWMKRLHEGSGIDLEAIYCALDGEAVLGVTLDAMEPCVLGALDLGDAYLGVHALMRLIAKGYFQMERRGELDIFTTRAGGEAARETSFCFHRGRLLFAVGEGAMDRLLAGPSSPLSANARYTEAVARSFGADADFRLWLDLAPLVQLAAGGEGSEAAPVLAALGLDGARSLVLAATIDGQEVRERLVFLRDGSSPILERLLVNEPASRETLARVPAAVESCVAARIRLDWIPGLVARLAARHADSAATAVAESLGVAQAELGMPLEACLAALGDEVVFLELRPPVRASVDERMQNPFRDSLLAWRLVDETRVCAALDHLAGNRGWLRREEIPGMPGRWWRIACGLPFEPHLTVGNGWAAVAADHSVLGSFLSGPARRSVLDSPLFEVRLRTMPEAIAVLGYCDLRPSAEQFLELLQGVLPMIAGALDGAAEVPFDLHRVPEARVITQHLTPATAYVQLIEDGVVLECVSPFGTAVLGLPLAVLGGAAAIGVSPLPDATRGDDRGGPPAIRVPRFLAPVQRARSSDSPPPAAGGDPAAPPERGDAARKPHNPRHNERNAIHLLRSLVDAQVMFQQAGAVDADHDGTGEFGTLGEMAGTAPLRHTGRPIEAPILTPVFGKVEQGALRRSGYRFRLYLPGEDGTPLAEQASGGAPSGVDPARAARCWCAIAWPECRIEGARSFYVDQTGRVFQSLFDYGGDNPAPDAGRLLDRDQDPAWGLRISDPAADGSRWTLLE
ncbi:MAG: hypothetical protein JXQ29_08685, partial [Planctomycetes bacterium]|nr:hypothetical protein [Planctomycetota bacterium]